MKDDNAYNFCKYFMPKKIYIPYIQVVIISNVFYIFLPGAKLKL